MTDNIKTICLIDPETEKKKFFRITLVAQGGLMSNDRNSLCFCGSGKKKKKCHPDIHEKSLFATLLKYYKEIDDEQALIDNSMCKKGCSKCCEASFSISQAEFFMILNALEITKDTQLFKRKADEFIANQGFEIGNRCIFVDDATGACRIYEVRPLICRQYGYINTNDCVCDYIKDNKELLNSLPTESKVKIAHNTISFDNGILLTPKPLVYWLSHLSDDGELATLKQKKLYEAAQASPISEYLRLVSI